LERQLLWRDLSGGLSFESEGGGFALGPSIDLELPVFDQNQAGIAKAEYRYAQALRRLEGAAVQVSQQVDSAFEGYLLAQDLARLYRDELLPLEEANLGLARESFAAGKTGFLSVLEAQRRYLRARREYVDHLEAIALSIPKLEAACGRSFHLLVNLGD
jgi:cobalt-zinc-cadmium efflux system outer membrane protein